MDWTLATALPALPEALPLLVGAGLAGLFGSAHCVGMCGGLVTAAGMKPGHVLAWSAGRITTYAMLGAASGAIGGAVALLGPWAAVLAGTMLVFFAAELAGLRLPRPPTPRWLTRSTSWAIARRGWGARFTFGLLTGLLPCGLVYTALALPIAGSGPVLGAAVMVTFGLGTVPALGLLGVAAPRLAVRSRAGRWALAAAVLCAGAWGLGARSMALAVPADGPAAEVAPAPTCH